MNTGFGRRFATWLIFLTIVAALSAGVWRYAY
jgi:hypothetical protein